MEFGRRGNLCSLVFFEVCSDALSAITREKQLKSWSRKKKNQLVESQNKQWQDVYYSLIR
jgi:putative endonuclease